MNKERKKRWIEKIRQYLFFPFPLQNKALIFTFTDQFSCNPKYIALSLKKTGKIRPIRVVSKGYKETTPPQQDIEFIRDKSFLYYYHLSTARFWISNKRTFTHQKKRSGQYYIQTWHGDIGFKKVEKAAEEKLSNAYLKCAKYDAKISDLMLVGSKWSYNDKKNDYYFDGEILEIGTPRNDILINSDKKIQQQFKKKLLPNSDENTLCILYAPTFRKDDKALPIQLNFQSISKAFSEKWQKKVQFIIRLHPNLHHLNKYYRKLFPEDAIFANDYEDIQELLLISDVLISDYSSTVFDFSLLKRPIFLFCPDFDNYQKERGFHESIDIQNLPFPMIKDNESFIKSINDFDEKSYPQKVKQLLEKLGSYEKGNASEKITNWMIDKLNKL